MKWTEEEARRYFSPNPQWEGRRSANWEPAQALIAALDKSREQAAKDAATVTRWIDECYRVTDLLDAERERSAKLERENTQLLALTHALYEHPEDYDGPCECQTCMSYGVSDTP